MGDEYRELFKVEYSGTISDLQKGASSVVGVVGVSAGTPGYERVDGVVDCEVTYDTYETDRTRVANMFEEINGVAGVTFG